MADQIEPNEIADTIAERLLASAADLPEGFIITQSVAFRICLWT
jgi:hypothetical protein